MTEYLIGFEKGGVMHRFWDSGAKSVKDAKLVAKGKDSLSYDLVILERNGKDRKKVARKRMGQKGWEKV